MFGNHTMGQKRDSTVSLLVLTQPCAPVGTDGTDGILTLSFAYLASYLGYEQLEKEAISLVQKIRPMELVY